MLVENMDGIFQVELVSVHDPTVWLRNLNAKDPVIFPVWPTGWPETLAVCVEGKSGNKLKISYATTRDAMLAYKGPLKLWFCNIPKKPFMSHVIDVNSNIC